MSSRGDVSRRADDPYSTKYLYVTHSELNAILNYRGRQPGGQQDLCDPLPLQ